MKFSKLNLAMVSRRRPVRRRFLRNVLIYFSIEIRREILNRIRRVSPAQWLPVLGGAETTLGVDAQWERVVVGPSTFYRPVP